MNNRFILAKPKIIAIIAGIFLFILFGEISARADGNEIDINTKMNPSGYFFEVGNLKPGDWMPRDITILNEGTQDFRYTAMLGKKKSVKGLLEELDLIVKKGEEVLYEGKMDEFTGFTPRSLVKGDSETLFFQVTMPSELGNAFQSSGAEVEILFVAEALGDTGGGEPGEGNPGEEPPGEEPPGDGGSDEGDPNGGDPVEEESGDGSTNEGDPDKGDSENGSSDEGGPNGGDPVEEESGDGSTNEGDPDKGDSENGGSDEGEPNGANPEEGDQIGVDTDGEVIETNSPAETIVVSPEVRKNLLPKTATNTYNILLIGSVLFIAGSILLYFYRHKIQNNE
ncbi:LPXTG cell wall anchor domain-containing protein [Cytobacillus massiliigabonensis]|uniref:LPXTG cell wall anchor domain-containing protein n=1 Tax=Cytobacillus massiliigabonensis TaxID=1871011 RepID=UPI000C8380B1|nr:LPXTG cell wall anchor domain-containing protein [Cytobacillus massiliigabonensis]